MKYLAAAALALLVATPALAQAPGTDANKPAATPATPAPAAQFVTKENPNEILVGNLWNKPIYDASGKQIGDLKDMIVTPEGKIQALVIGVGGFLGLGEKSVAVNFDYLEKNGSIKPDRITLKMTDQDLRNAPNFVRLKGAQK